MALSVSLLLASAVQRSPTSAQKMFLDIRARPPPSAFRGLPVFLPGILMDTINQLAAVFHLRMYHCPIAMPLASGSGTAERIVGEERTKTFCYCNPENVILAPPRSFPEVLRRFSRRLTNDGIDSRSSKFSRYCAPTRIFIDVLLRCN